MCLAHGPQRSDAGEARTRGPSVSSQDSTTEPLRSQHIENRKRFTEVLSPRDQTNPFECSCSFTFYTSYKNGMIGHGGTLSKRAKTLYYKNLLETYFVKTCR